MASRRRRSGSLSKRQSKRHRSPAASALEGQQFHQRKVRDRTKDEPAPYRHEEQEQDHDQVEDEDVG